MALVEPVGVAALQGFQFDGHASSRGFALHAVQRPPAQALALVPGGDVEVLHVPGVALAMHGQQADPFPSDFDPPHGGRMELPGEALARPRQVEPAQGLQRGPHGGHAQGQQGLEVLRLHGGERHAHAAPTASRMCFSTSRALSGMGVPGP